jgi:hypothetical protein
MNTFGLRCKKQMHASCNKCIEYIHRDGYVYMLEGCDGINYFYSPDKGCHRVDGPAWEDRNVPGLRDTWFLNGKEYSKTEHKRICETLKQS